MGDPSDDAGYARLAFMAWAYVGAAASVVGVSGFFKAVGGSTESKVAASPHDSRSSGKRFDGGLLGAKNETTTVFANIKVTGGSDVGLCGGATGSGSSFNSRSRSPPITDIFLAEPTLLHVGSASSQMDYVSGSLPAWLLETLTACFEISGGCGVVLEGHANSYGGRGGCSP